jgi:hypothetical protein
MVENNKSRQGERLLNPYCITPTFKNISLSAVHAFPSDRPEIKFLGQGASFVLPQTKTNLNKYATSLSAQ